MSDAELTAVDCEVHFEEVRFDRAADLTRTVGSTGLGYALIDRARDPGFVSAVGPIDAARFRNLLPAKRNVGLCDVAPHLLCLASGGPLIDQAVSRVFEAREYVFFKARARVSEVYKHLRQLLVVEDEAGSSKLFRFYDPRVLRPYLETVTSDEARRFFGPIESFWIGEGSRGAALRAEYLGEHEQRLGRSWRLPLIREEQRAHIARRTEELFIDRWMAAQADRGRPRDTHSRARVQAGMALGRQHGITSWAGLEEWLGLLDSLPPLGAIQEGWIEASDSADEQLMLRRLARRIRQTVGRTHQRGVQRRGLP